MITIAVALNVSCFGLIEESSIELYLSNVDIFEDVLTTIVTEIGNLGFILSYEIKVISDTDRDILVQKTEGVLIKIKEINNKFCEKELKTND